MFLNAPVTSTAGCTPDVKTFGCKLRTGAKGRRWSALGALCLLAALLPAQAQEAYYIHTDALGSPVAETDANRNVVRRFEYEPYGRRLGEGNDDRPGYTGHVMDAATGLVYAQQRYLWPEGGIFLSVDPVTAYSNPVGQFHRYRYANNNPYTMVDPDGRSALTKAIKLALNGGNVAQTFAGVVSDYKTLTDPKASAGERLLAAASLASEAAPISIGDAKDAAQGMRMVADKVGGKASDRAIRDGRASRYEPSTEGRSVANRETNVSQESMKDNLSDSGYSSTSSQDGSVQVFSNGEKSYVFRTDKPSVDYRSNGDASGKPELKIRIKDEP
jgi:RHS repeat-associated protein